MSAEIIDLMAVRAARDPDASAHLIARLAILYEHAQRARRAGEFATVRRIAALESSTLTALEALGMSRRYALSMRDAVLA